MPPATEPDLSRKRFDFKVAVLALDRGCIASRPITLGEIASPCEGSLAAHHVVTQQQLRHLGRDDLLWDPANGVSLCYRHHRRHHSRHEPIPYALLPKRCRDFAGNLGVAYLLDRYYV